MLVCPHCAARLRRADLSAQRILRPRTCASCGRQYFEGGTTTAAAFIGAGGALAGRLNSLVALPSWVPAAIVLGCAALGILYTTTQTPRPIHELRQRLTAAFGATVLSALAVSVLLRIVST